ncbi:MAG: SUMF1/EgtB/PvdO family nonheme iron enzyme [Anaerolineae bacterium]|nr:SUMF1/EgtB/PvdO family nonheme iron enzyme [Anaerolineae bacterium]
MDKQTWQQQLQNRAEQFKAWLADRADRDAPYVVYGGLMASTLWPLIDMVTQTGSVWPVGMALGSALGSTAGSVGAGLIANQLEAWKGRADRLTQDEVAEWVTTQAATNSDLRDLFNSLLVELNSVAALSPNLTTADRQRLADTLRQELAQLGTPSNTIETIIGSGNLVIQGSDLSGGDRSVVGSNAGRDIITGDNNKISYTTIEQQTIIYPDDSAEVRRDKLKRRYLSRLAHRCNLLPLAVLGGEQSTKETVSLEDVYISLDTLTRVSLTEVEIGKLHDPFVVLQTNRPLAVIEVATQHRYLALLGDPGSGKSTFVQQVVAKLAQVRLGLARPLDGWPQQPWPILTLLRDLAPRLRDLPLAEPPTERQERALVEAVKAQWQADLQKLEVADLAADLAHLLADEMVVLVFDGLDEVPEGLRRHVRLAVQAVLKAYPGIARVIITCRIRSYVGAAVLPAFDHHTLAPFDEAKIKAFVGAWYQTQADLGRLTPAQAEERSADLRQAALSDALRELSSNPMLLTTMAIIHQRDAELPRERVRLYDEAVKVLLGRWQRHKEIEVSDQLQAVLSDPLKLRRIIERLAYEIHRRQSQSRRADATNQGDLPRMDALLLLEETHYLGDLSLASQFLDYVDQRAGLLQGRGGEEGNKAAIAYTFPHRTFQEYLAGCHLVSGRSVSREYWQRVAEGDFWTLAGQMGAEELLFNRRNLENLLDLAYALCPTREPASDIEWRAAVWSGQMAVTLGQAAIEADAGTPDGGLRYFQRLTKRLQQSLGATEVKAIERVEAGRTLGRLNADDRPGVGLRADGLPDISWCDIPAGSFLFGDYKKEVTLPAFRMSRYPITNAQFDAFVQDGGYTEQWRCCWTEVGWKNKGDRQMPLKEGGVYDLPNHPVVVVSWYEAVAYCRWLTVRLRERGELAGNEEVSLPTDSQWEKAARGTDGREYPWGDEADPNRANYDATGLGTTSAVGCFAQGASPYGCLDMSGNVLEWCRTKNKDLSDNDLEGTAGRVVRGGSWDNDLSRARASYRSWGGPSLRNNNFGFRVCRPPSQ